LIKAIEGYPGYYAKDNGEIWSVKKGAPRRLVPTLNRKGYERVKLSIGGISKTITVHRLIATTFIPNPENKPQVNHKDEDKRNNKVTNLEWSSCLENVRYGTGIARSAKSRKGIKVDNAKVIEANKKPIFQLDKNGNILKAWASITDASRELNIRDSHISACCKGKRITCGGFKWRYQNAE